MIFLNQVEFSHRDDMDFNILPATFFQSILNPQPRAVESGQGVRAETHRPVPRSQDGPKSRPARDEGEKRGQKLDILV